MADQNISTRPRRSAAVEAQVKVEEYYAIWGQPPSDNGPGCGQLGKKRSAAGESSAGRKRRRASLQHQAESGTPTVLEKTEVEDKLVQLRKRGPGWSRKNLIRRQTLVAIEELSKKITLGVPDSLAFRQGLRKIRDIEHSSLPSSKSQVAGQAVVGTVTEIGSNFSTQAEQLEVVNVREVPATPHAFSLFSAEPLAPSESKSEYSVDHVQAPAAEALQNEAQNDRSSPGAKTGAADYLEGMTRFGPADSELPGVASELVTPKGGSDNAHWLDQQEADADIQETERPKFRSSTTTPPFIVEHTHPILKLSSPAVQSPGGFVGTRETHDLVMSAFDSVQQRNPTPAWQHSSGDIEAIQRLAAQMEQEISLADKDRMIVYLDNALSTQQRQSINQNQIRPLVYHFRTEAVIQYFHKKMTDSSVQVNSLQLTSSAMHPWASVLNGHVWQPRRDSPFWPGSLVTNTTAQTFSGGKFFSNRPSSDIQKPQVLHQGMSLFPGFNHERQGWQKVGQMSDFTHTTEDAKVVENADMRDTSLERSDGRPSLSMKALQAQHEQHNDTTGVIHEPIQTTPNPFSKVGRSGSGIDEFVLHRRPKSVHPPPMKRNTPNIYFDRNPQGSSIGTHSFDSIVGLPDHSDPRTFHTPDSKDWAHVLAALQPSIDHFRKLTDGAEPGEMPLDSGYEVAHSLLQAHLRSWLVINRPEYTHKNAIPKLFKLERWEGGIEHWKFASNSPVRFILPRISRPGLTAPESSDCTSSSSEYSLCNTIGSILS
jgi:hypothetical protein